MKYASFQSLLNGFLVFTTALLLVACGGGSGGGTASIAGGSGNVAVLLTDGPTQDFDEVNITVVKAELLSDSGRVTLFDGNKTFNLLDLTDAHVFAIRNDVPAGSYNKIRLTLTEIVLVRKDAVGNVIETAYPSLPGNGKLDLVARGDLYVAPGETLVLQIDMDANKSIHIVGTGSGKYQFRPVVFVDILSDLVPGKFIRLHGTVAAIDDEDREFTLCNSRIPVRARDHGDDDQTLGCIEVEVTDATSIFGEDGLAAGFDDLVTGEDATVYGRLQREDDGDVDDSDREIGDLELLASVIELGPEGTFVQLSGVADSTVDVDGRFTMTIDPQQGFVAGSQVAVQLQNGTAIIDRSGEPLDGADITPGVPVRVDGVLDISGDPDVLNAALVMVDADALSQTVLSGTIGANPDGSCGLTLLTGSGDRGVRTTSATRAYLVTAMASAGGSVLIPVEELTGGQDADIYGQEDTDGCFVAETVIAYQLDS